MFGNSSELRSRKRKLEAVVEEKICYSSVKKSKNSVEGSTNSNSSIDDSGCSSNEYEEAYISTERKLLNDVKVKCLRRDQDESIIFPNLKCVLSRNGPFSHPDFHPSTLAFEQLKKIKVLVVGAGGLGCEILKNLALMGFTNLSVLDMDKIDLSNLNRQLLFRRKDIGRLKAEVAAEFIRKRVTDCHIKPYCNKIEDFDQYFYQSFNIILCGLDSIFARQWINGMLLSLLKYDDKNNELDYSTIIPLLDGGTEGFKGNARVVLPGVTPCIDCSLDLYPPKVKYPLCTLANTPRLPEHCVEYVKMISWPKDNPWNKSMEFDGDDPSHVYWIYEKSLERANYYGITGVTYSLVQGVIKNIIPAVASTNAVIAAACVTEAFKIATNCYLPMRNNLLFNDVDGIYTHSFELQRKEECPSCSVIPNVIEENLESTLNDLINSVSQSSGYTFNNPGITANMKGKLKILYMSNLPTFEEKSCSNLSKSLQELGFQDGTEFMLTDKTFPKTLTFQLSLPKT